MIRLHYLQHVAFEGLGSIGAWAAARQYPVTATRLYKGDRLPEQAAFDCLVIMGGPMNIYEHEAHPWLTAEKLFIEQSLKNMKAIVGVCLGAQLLADVLGQKVYAGRYKEIGWFPIYKTDQARQSPAARFLPDTCEAFHWHGDTFDIPAGALHLARSEACAGQGFIYDQQAVGLQFHLETTRASAGQLIDNCRDEIVAGRFIQSAEQMLSQPDRFDALNSVMASLLESLSLFRQDQM